MLHHLLLGIEVARFNSGDVEVQCQRQWMSRPDSRSDSIGGSEPSSGYETQNWDS